LAVLLVLVGAPQFGWGQTPGANDFFSNTQSVDQRAAGGTSTTDAPGFNPCPGGTNNGGICEGSNGLLATSNLDTLFPSLGPGAITDNMFGIIAGVQPGAATTNNFSCAGNGTGTATGGTITISTGVLLNAGLNCGDLHFNPGSQGQSLPAPTTPNTNDLQNQFVSNTNFNLDSGADSTHVIFNLQNQFTWTPANTANTLANGSAVQSMHQQTALRAGTDGLQDVTITSNFTGSVSDANGVLQTNPVVTWTSSISDPDMSGSGEGFTQNIGGTFNYNASIFPVTQYPSGQTQTQRSQGLTPSAGSESLP
jgi:hypothetical protein